MNVRVAWIAVGLFALGTIGPAGLVPTDGVPNVSLAEDASARHVCPPDEPLRTVCQCLHPLECVDVKTDQAESVSVEADDAASLVPADDAAEVSLAPEATDEHVCIVIDEVTGSECACVHLYCLQDEVDLHRSEEHACPYPEPFYTACMCLHPLWCLENAVDVKIGDLIEADYAVATAS